MKITKKQVREFLKSARTEHPLGWRIDSVGAFLYNNKVELYTSYHGLGINRIVYNEEYDEIVDLKDYIDKDEYNLNDATDLAYEKIQDMLQ